MRKSLRYLLPAAYLILLLTCTVWQSNGSLPNKLIRFSGILSTPVLDALYAERGVYVMRRNGEKYIVSTCAETSGDYEASQLEKLYQYTQEHNTDFLYVNAPCKALLDDSIVSDYFGIENSCNANADRLTEKLRESGVPYLDLRENVKAEGKDIFQMFYRTDHHWRTESGLWATALIADTLNKRFDTGLDPAYFSQDYYDTQFFENAWIGEQGDLYSPIYIGYDSYTEITPKNAGSYCIADLDGSSRSEGDYTLLYNPNDVKRGFIADTSLHYSYCPNGLEEMRYENCSLPDGKRILLICDSYSNVVVPFLIQGVGLIDTIQLRSSEANLCDMIRQNDYDAVIVLYAQLMIGAHDNPYSANYRMFSFMPEE